jgi:S-adenosylmethionine decarboxylase
MEQLQNTYEQFGVHLMIDAYGASQEALKNKVRLKELLAEIPAAMGMHTICDPVIVEVGPNNHKDPGGVSGFIMIAESHWIYNN